MNSGRVLAEKFPDEAFERLAAFEDENFWFRSRNRLIVWAIERYFPAAEDLLEVGCGTGVVLRAIRARFPGLRIVGTDLSEEAIRVASGRVSAEFRQLDAREVSFEDEFDVACAFDVLEHVDDDRTVLARLLAATHRGGGLVVTVPQYAWLWSAADDYGGHQRRYTKREVHRTIEEAGFRVVRSSAWVSLLLPLVALSRLRDRRAGADYDPSREFRLPRAFNRAFERVLDAEGKAIRAGVTLPFGTSRLVVAVKR
jgi:SAM-dependent methyltransferase